MERTELLKELSLHTEIADSIPELGVKNKTMTHWFRISIALLVVFLPMCLIYTFAHAYAIYKGPSIVEVTNPLAIGIQLGVLVAICQIAYHSKINFKNYFSKAKPYTQRIEHLHSAIMKPESKSHLFAIAKEVGRDDMYLRALNIAFDLPMNEFRYKENIVIHALKLARDLERLETCQGNDFSHDKTVVAI